MIPEMCTKPRNWMTSLLKGGLHGERPSCEDLRKFEYLFGTDALAPLEGIPSEAPAFSSPNFFLGELWFTSRYSLDSGLNRLCLEVVPFLPSNKQ